MESVKVLLDMASQKCGSDAELARRIEDTRQHIGDMRRGTRSISPETVVLLCDVLELPGEECQKWVAQSLIENPKNASRVEVLKRALFACGGLGVAFLLTLFFGAPGTAWSAARTRTAPDTELTRYVSVTHQRIIDAYLRAFALMARCLRWSTSRAGTRGVAIRPGTIAAAGLA